MSKTVSKIIAVAATLILAFAFIIGGAFMQIEPAAAATTTEIVNAKIVDRVAYGNDITVPAAKSGKVTVKTPGGTFADITDNKVKATQVGVYEITYNDATNGKYASYTYGVECYMDYEYKLIVDNNGGAIPTYRETGKKFTLPSATLYYNDKDENALLPVKAADGGNEIYARVTTPSGVKTTYNKAELAEGVEVEPTENGMYFVTYYAKVLGGDNLESVEYTVQVQNKFEDTKAPTIAINGVTQSGSVNTKFDIQRATVSDNFDGSRVVTNISVTHDYGGEIGVIAVPEAVVDKSTGYAAKDADGKSLYYEKGETERYAYEADGSRKTTADITKAVSAIFDNDSFMSFYPTEDGAYTLSYGAYDSLENGKNVAPQTFTLTVSDYTVPTVKSFDQSLIPSRWGLTVKKQDELNANDTVELDDTNIQFPIPELIDNSGDKNLSVAFALTRTQNTKTFVSVSNIYATEPSNKSMFSGSSSSYGDTDSTYYFFRYWLSEDYAKGNFTVSATDGKITGKWTVDGEEKTIGDSVYSLVYYDDAAKKPTKGFFNFDKINDSNKTATYTARYTRSDGKNSQSASYSIELQSTFTDTNTPNVDFETPDYFLFRDYETSQSITDVTVNDGADARLGVEYYIVFNQDGFNDKDGDTIKWSDTNISDEKIANWLENGDAIELGASAGSNAATLEKKGADFTVTMEDVNGDEKTVTVDMTKKAYVALRATDSVGQSAFKIEELKVVDGTADVTNYAPVFTSNGLNTDDSIVGQEHNFGSFYIDYGDVANRNYVGFELYVKRVKDSEDKEVEDGDERVSFETYSDNGAASTNYLHVDNIRFTPNRAGTYMLVVRGFHVSGKSSVQLAFIKINANGGTNSGEATALPKDIEYNKTYYLESSYRTSLTSENGVGILRSITGGRCSLMGNEFVAKDNVTYFFNDYAFVYDKSTNATATDRSLIKYNYEGETTPDVKAGKSLAKDFIANEHESVGTLVDATASDSSSATFRVLGDTMPTYTDITKTVDGTTTRVYVKLPNVSASSSTDNAREITVAVTDPNGTKVETFDASSTNVPAGYTLEGNEFLFEATVDGSYTVEYTATMPNGQTANANFTIKAGDVIAPVFHIDFIGSINGKNQKTGEGLTVNVNDTFGFAAIVLDETSSSSYTYTKVLYDPKGDVVVTVNHKDRPYSGTDPYTFTQAGTYRIVYTVQDAAGNSTTIDRYITVAGKSKISSSSTATLAVVLIIVGVIIIAGLIIYFIRFRKRKSKDNK